MVVEHSDQGTKRLVAGDKVTLSGMSPNGEGTLVVEGLSSIFIAGSGASKSMKLTHERMTGTAFKVGDNVEISAPSLHVTHVEVDDAGIATASIDDTSTAILSAGDKISFEGAVEEFTSSVHVTVTDISCDMLSGIATATHSSKSAWNQAISYQVLKPGDEIVLTGTTNFDGQHRIITATSSPLQFSFSLGACIVPSENGLTAEGKVYVMASLLNVNDVTIIGTPTATQFSFEVANTFYSGRSAALASRCGKHAKRDGASESSNFKASLPSPCTASLRLVLICGTQS